MAPSGSWSNLFRGGATGALLSSGSILGVYEVYCEYYSSITRFSTLGTLSTARIGCLYSAKGTACTRGSVLLALRVFTVFGTFVAQ